MFCPNAISAALALSRSAIASRAHAMAASVSALDGYGQCVLALWWYR
jgi:hypothetical protein